MLDEAQRIKNWSSKTAQAVKRLDSRYAFVLTGTPLENRIDELKSIVDFLDPGPLGTLFRFNREYYDLDERGRPKGYKNLEKLRAKVAPTLQVLDSATWEAMRIRPASDLLVKASRVGYIRGHGNNEPDPTRGREAPPPY